MIDHNSEDDAFTELLSFKTKLERNISDLNEEKNEIKQKIKAIREESALVRKGKNEELQQLYRARMSLVDAQKKVACYDEYMNAINETMANIGDEIRGHMKLTDSFEKPINQINSSLEGAITFYSDDSLQMELMKRSNAVRERRVEYTRLESDINDLTRKIEERKREQERIKLAELERARIEEEKLRRVEEERIRRAEEEKAASDCQKNKIQSFLGDKASVISPVRTVDFILPKSINQQYDDGTEASSDNQIGTPKTATTKSPSFPEVSTFSQYFKW